MYFLPESPAGKGRVNTYGQEGLWCYIFYSLVIKDIHKMALAAERIINGKLVLILHLSISLSK